MSDLLKIRLVADRCTDFQGMVKVACDELGSVFDKSLLVYVARQIVEDVIIDPNTREIDLSGVSDEQVIDAVRDHVPLSPEIVERLERAEGALEQAVFVLERVNDLTFAVGKLSEWASPQGTIGVYHEGDTVAVDGVVWVSLIDNNVWPPGKSGWREVLPGGGVSAWVHPSGSSDPYRLGDAVTHVGFVWESIIENNVWVPGEFGWVKIREDD